MNGLKRVLAVLGDFYHDAELAKQALLKVAEPFVGEGGVKVSFADWSQLDERLDEQPDLVVLFTENRTAPQTDETQCWMTADIERKIEQYVSGGGAWLAWHSGMASYPEDGAYANMLKGAFISHPEQHAPVTYTPQAGTALGELGEPFQFMDEHYFVWCREEETNVFLRSSSIDGESIAGWLHPYGEGRVGCITPAHLAEGLFHPSFVQAMQRLVAWCLDMQA